MASHYHGDMQDVVVIVAFVVIALADAVIHSIDCRINVVVDRMVYNVVFIIAVITTGLNTQTLASKSLVND